MSRKNAGVGWVYRFLWAPLCRSHPLNLVAVVVLVVLDPVPTYFKILYDIVMHIEWHNLPQLWSVHPKGMFTRVGFDTYFTGLNPHRIQ